MMFSEYLPKSNVGCYINGIYLEKALVERLCLSYPKSISLKCSMDVNFVDWMFLVGIYKSQEKYFLLLEANEHSSAIDSMIDDGIFPNTGFKLISDSTAAELTSKISKLGNEYFEIFTREFNELMGSIISSMDCQVVFTPLLNVAGYFDRNEKVIVVANNNSQFLMIWTLVHEYVHFLLNSDKKPPSTIEEYLCSKEEYLCDTIAFKLVTKIFGIDVITSIIEKALSKMKNAYSIAFGFNVLKECDLRDILSPEEYCIMAYYMTENVGNDKELQFTIDYIFGRILSVFETKTSKTSKTHINCTQTGLVKLAPSDNHFLFDIIMNELSPMISDE